VQLSITAITVKRGGKVQRVAAALGIAVISVTILIMLTLGWRESAVGMPFLHARVDPVGFYLYGYT